MEDRYNEWHDKHDHDDDTNAPWHRFVKKNLRSSDLSDKKILEIGCGRGGFSNYLSRQEHRPAQIVASDYSTTGLDIARRKYGVAGGVIHWKQEDITALSFANNTFDTIISCETIEHVEKPRNAINELFRVLKPGGRLLLTCPNYFNVFGIWCLYRWIIKKPFTEGGQPYVNYILFPKIYSWLLRAGFRVEQFKSSEIIIPARVPKHLWNDGIPYIFKPFGYRTFYVLVKDRSAT